MRRLLLALIVGCLAAACTPSPRATKPPPFRLNFWGAGIDPARGGQLAELMVEGERVARLRVSSVGARVYAPDATRLGRLRPNADGVELVNRSADARCSGHADALGLRLDCGDEGVFLGAWREDGSFDARFRDAWLGTREAPAEVQTSDPAQASDPALGEPEGSGEASDAAHVVPFGAVERWRMEEAVLRCDAAAATLETFEGEELRRFDVRPGSPPGASCSLALGLVALPELDDALRGAFAWAVWASTEQREREAVPEGSGGGNAAER